MRKVDRDMPGPDSLSAPFAGGANKGLTEREAAEAFYGAVPRSGSFSFRRYSEDPVKLALERMFHRKCAYCESAYGYVHPVDVEHYRPKGAVDGASGHDGYWWLAMEWENLLPSCIDCNRRRGQTGPNGAAMTSGKATQFPIAPGSPRWAAPKAANTEERLLIDPCRDDPADHLTYAVAPGAPLGVMQAKAVGGGDAMVPTAATAAAAVADADAAGVSRMGAVSIQVYGLNRTGLVQARTRVLRDMEFLYTLAVSLGELAEQMRDRIAGQGAAPDPMDARVLAKLTALRAATFDRLRAKLAPDAPYCEAARAWARAMIAP